MKERKGREERREGVINGMNGKEKRVVVSSIIIIMPDPSSSSGCTIEVTVQPLS